MAVPAIILGGSVGWVGGLFERAVAELLSELELLDLARWRAREVDDGVDRLGPLLLREAGLGKVSAHVFESRRGGAREHPDDRSGALAEAVVGFGHDDDFGHGR